MREKTRKCKICKELIYLENKNEDYIVVPGGKSNTYIHSCCYIKYHTTKKQKPKTEEECKLFIEECKKNNEELVSKNNIKNDLYAFLFDMYDISFFPNYFYIKMESVFKGTYKNLNTPVPPEDLLDMWKQKKNYLNKVAEQNRKKGSEITGVNRVNYDLAILLSRYDAYLKWKEEQKIAVAELNESKKRSIEKIEYLDVARPNKTLNLNEKVDISTMLDEI